jgi:HD-GYP domain-containing protein (c-di-GMP phosphodiesterase class II)
VRYIDVNSVEPGQILGRSIFSSNGTVLLAENVQLTVYMISTLKRVGVTMVYIKDPQFDDVELEEVVSEETKRAVMGKMIETFDAIRSGKDFHTKQLSITVDKLLEEIFENKDVLVQLTDIRSDDNYHYVHALNVCMMSVLVGLNCGFNAQQLKELAIGALLHDIGKIGLEPEEEAASGKKHHTWRGFEIIKSKHEFSLMSAHVALQHHERVDGKGLPRGIDGDTIHPYAKIVAIANAYDNMVAPRSSSGKPIMPHEACERLMAMAGNELDRDYVIEFLKIVSVYPTGITVQLTTRETGVIVGQHRGLPSRPIVRIVRVDGGMNDMQVKEIDLARNPTIFIDKVIN